MMFFDGSVLDAKKGVSSKLLGGGKHGATLLSINFIMGVEKRLRRRLIGIRPFYY